MSLSLDGITVTYGSTIAVDNASFDLGPGIHALLGPNGAGKSSLLEVLATLRKPSSGSFNLDGLTGRSVRNVLGYLPQDNLPKSRFTVREHLAYMCWLKTLDRTSVPAEVDRVVELAELPAKVDATVASLSGGMRRRVGIASALVGSPKLVILDEASAGLDMVQRDSLQRILSNISPETIVVTSTHIVEDIVDIADTVTVISDGHVKFSGPWQTFCSTGSISEFKARYVDLVEAK